MYQYDPVTSVTTPLDVVEGYYLKQTYKVSTDELSSLDIIEDAEELKKAFTRVCDDWLPTGACTKIVANTEGLFVEVETFYNYPEEKSIG